MAEFDPADDAEVDDGESVRDSRDRLLDAATELVLEHYSSATGYRDAFAYLTPGLVAARAGLSRTLIHHHWSAGRIREGRVEGTERDVDGEGAETRDAFGWFLTDLADHIWAISFDLSDLSAAAALLPDEMTAMVQVLSDVEIDRTMSTTRAMLRATQALTLHSCISNSEAEAVLDRLVLFYDAILERVGREMVPPLTTRQLAFVLASLLDGFAIQANVVPDRAGERVRWRPTGETGTDDWSLFGVAVEGIVTNMTRPIGEPGPEA